MGHPVHIQYIFWCKTLLMMTLLSQRPRSNAIHLAMICAAAANTVEHGRTQQYIRQGDATAEQPYPFSQDLIIDNATSDRSRKGPNHHI